MSLSIVPAVPVSRIALGIPLYGHVSATTFMWGLSHLAHGIANGSYAHLAMIEGAYIDQARNQMVQQILATAEEDKLSHILFLDQDVILPEDAAPRLVAHDLPVIGAAYFGRNIGHHPVAFDLNPFTRLTDIDITGLNKVGGVGMGATLINLDVFRQMQDHYKDEWWFRCSPPPDTAEGRQTGEDVWFAERCAELGIPIALDGSIHCQHMASVPITVDHYLAARESV